MTGYTVHTGTTKAFVTGWDRIFGEQAKGGSAKKDEARKTGGKKKKEIVRGPPIKVGVPVDQAGCPPSDENKEVPVHEEFTTEDFEAQDDELELYEDEAVEMDADEEYEEISSEEVDRVVGRLEDLMDTVDSENIKTFIEDAINSIYYLVYEPVDESDSDSATDAA